MSEKIVSAEPSVSMRENTILVIYNPVSGQWQNHNNIFDLVEAISQIGMATLIRMTTGRGDGTKIVMEYGPYVRQVIVCGGDGTLHEVIYGMRQAGLDIPVGYIPVGTTNDFAVNHQIPPDFHAALENILQGRGKRIDIGRINKDDTFNYVCCFGVFTRTSYETSQALKNVLGYLAYILQGALEIGEIGNPTHMIVKTDDKVYEGDYIFGAVVNSYNVAHFFRLPGDLVDLSDGLFEVLLVKQPANIIEAHLIAQALLNASFSDPHIELTHASEVRFFSNKPVKWCADGEFAGEFKEVLVENEHNAVEILVNENSPL